MITIKKYFPSLRSILKENGKMKITITLMIKKEIG